LPLRPDLLAGQRAAGGACEAAPRRPQSRRISSTSGEAPIGSILASLLKTTAVVCGGAQASAKGGASPQARFRADRRP
ncbi:MAG TPA: hypothetical protein PKW88_06605, partial [Plasticicumulans sp.]|nr:hypothetical protein [Plasticicumulans sp.]HMX54703.1 hypothetical protein [Plasticicumulans sp.]HMZ10367.1 hypothetical protein [Plasticicumulans sp.]